MALPDIDDLILDRLVVCAKEIPGLTGDDHVTRFEPPVKDNTKFPLFFFEVGGLAQPLNAPIAQAASNHFVHERVLRAKLLIRPIAETEHSATDGTHEDEEVRPFLASIKHYFAISHPFLGTDAVPGKFEAKEAGNWTLALLRRVQISENGIQDVPDRYTVDLYHGCIFTLNVQAQLVVHPSLIGA